MKESTLRELRPRSPTPWLDSCSNSRLYPAFDSSLGIKGSVIVKVAPRPSPSLAGMHGPAVKFDKMSHD